jgi:phosphate transport system permease protein
MAAHSIYGSYTRLKSHLMLAACFACTAGILLILVLVLGYLVSIGFRSLHWSFFTELPTGTPRNPGGMRHAIAGTGVLIFLASLVGAPIGLLAGIFLSEYSSKSPLAGPVRFTADVLAGVPSIVVGILGYELLVVPLGHYNGWAGALALAFIMIPIVARTSEEMLRLVPRSYREASIALGASRARTIFRVVIPAATGGLVTSIMLAVARIAGETAPLLFTALGSRLMTLDPNEPFPSLTKQIYDYATGPYPEQKRLAWAGLLVLISLILGVNILARIVTHRMQRHH